MINIDEEQIEIDKYLINLVLVVDSKGNDNEKKELIISFKEYLSIICQSEISLNNLFQTIENLDGLRLAAILHDMGKMYEYDFRFRTNRKK